LKTSRILGLGLCACLAACSGRDRSSSRGTDRSGAASDVNVNVNALELAVAFSSEKKDWVQDAITAFHASPTARTADGRPIRVRATFGGSIEPIEQIVGGRSRVTVFSPASSLVIPLLNDAWLGARGATARPIAGASEQLVLSPVVIAMWRPMAEALGWPRERIGWADLATLAENPRGWSAHGHPEWGAFKLGHTHPGYSNSGLIAVLAANYAAMHKVRDLAEADVRSDAARSFVRDLESAVVHYGRSTGFFHDELEQHGPSYLSAAILYENLVVTTDARQLPFPLVCLYPEEGTMWADHPYVILDADWVTPAHKDAAVRFRDFLLSRPIQERALRTFGFRPANTDVPLSAPIDAAHGADPREPQTLLATPDTRVLRAALDGWSEDKRAVSVVVVFDRSSSMTGARIQAAKAGLTQFLAHLRPEDRVQLVTFSSEVDDSTPEVPPADISRRVATIFADGHTALYDAIDRARTLAFASARRDPRRIHAVVVLTDGEDTSSRTTADALLPRLGDAEAGTPVRIFTIGYGAEANAEVLRSIATRAGGAYYSGDVQNIRAIYEEVASFF